MDVGQSCGHFHLSFSQISPRPTIECFQSSAMASYHLCWHANDSHDSLINSLLWANTVTKETSWKRRSLGLRVAEEESIALGRLGGIWRPEQESKRSHPELQTRGGEFVNSQVWLSGMLPSTWLYFPKACQNSPNHLRSSKPDPMEEGGYFSLRGTPSSLWLHGLLAAS